MIVLPYILILLQRIYLYVSNNMTYLTYIISFIALGVLARAFFSWNDNDPIVRADTMVVVSQEPSEIKDLNNPLDSSVVSLPQDDEIFSANTTPALIINEVSPWEKNNLPLPSSINHEVIFFPQAPDGNRKLPRQEACEEASIALASYFIKGKLLTKDQIRTDILSLVDRQMELFNDYLHTTVEQTKQLYLDFYGGEAYIIDNPTIEQIKEILAQWHLIVAPFAGRKLGNPYYSWPGPLYHMMVIRWYDDRYFYTNDVGTRRGENYPYSYQTILDANHDRADDINQGAKKMLVITK